MMSPATAAADPAGDGTVTQSHHHAHLGRAALTKVPQIIVLFWVSKILITAMGEATSDYMNQALGPAIAVPLMLIGLYLALRLQFRQDRYNAWTYWLVVVMVAIFGTSAADALHVGLGIPYVISTLFYAREALGQRRQERRRHPGHRSGGGIGRNTGACPSSPPASRWCPMRAPRARNSATRWPGCSMRSCAAGSKC